MSSIREEISDFFLIRAGGANTDFPTCMFLSTSSELRIES